MATPLVVSQLLNVLGLVLTLSVLLLMIWHNWRAGASQALLLFLGSLALLQAGTFMTHFGLLVDFPEVAVEIFLNLTLVGFILVPLTTLALLLYAADAMKDAWSIVCRTGVTAVLIIQPALWRHGLLELPDPLDEHLFGSPYTQLGRVMVGVGVGYIALTVFAGQHYWRRINAPLLSGALIGLMLAQLATLSLSTLRELSLTAVTGGVVSGVLGYHFIRQFDFDPRSSQLTWLKALNQISQTITRHQALSVTLADVAEQVRQLLRTDGVSMMVAVSVDQLEIIAVAGLDHALVGRQIQIGDGLAGRVMQTMQPMRVENYRAWDGRAPAFEGMPFYASVGVPLVYGGMLVGVLYATETTPGRVFTDRDQSILEFLGPQAAVAIAQARLELWLGEMGTVVRSVIANTDSAALLFDAQGNLHTANRTARHFLDSLFGDAVNPTLDELAARAQDENLRRALKQWAAAPHQRYELETGYERLGRLDVQLLPIGHDLFHSPHVLMILHLPDNGPGPARFEGH